jgi:hypothetical protein
MEWRTLEAEAFLTSTKGSEVLTGLWGDLIGGLLVSYDYRTTQLQHTSSYNSNSILSSFLPGGVVS